MAVSGHDDAKFWQLCHTPRPINQQNRRRCNSRSHDQWHHILTQRLPTHKPQHHFMYPSVQRRRMLQSHTLALLSPTHITHLCHQFFPQFPHGRLTSRARQPLLRTENNSASDSRRAHDGFRWRASCRGRFNRSSRFCEN